jgi:hypothetical protein
VLQCRTQLNLKIISSIILSLPTVRETVISSVSGGVTCADRYILNTRCMASLTDSRKAQ